MAVAGLGVGPSAVAGIPHVDRVLLATGEELRCDLVVDAMGRRSRLADWLDGLGARPPRVESEDSGFVYHTRYFRGPEPPATIGPVVTPLGTVSVLTLMGDNGTWSVTVWGASADSALRGLRDPARFSAVIGACPLQAHWLDGEAITDIVVMAGILDRYRRYVVDDRPAATGVVAVGDAWACTNPSAGRGLSVGLLHAQRLRDVLREGMDDPHAVVRRFDAATEADVTPFYRNQIAADRTRIREMDALRRGDEPPPPDPTAAAINAAVPRDPDVFRGLDGDRHLPRAAPGGVLPTRARRPDRDLRRRTRDDPPRPRPGPAPRAHRLAATHGVDLRKGVAPRVRNGLSASLVVTAASHQSSAACDGWPGSLLGTVAPFAMIMTVLTPGVMLQVPLTSVANSAASSS